ncbi:putative entry exclusion protein TrbK-alt [Rhodopila sp.]|uniref:putative entry exclusion protein TrbK-alt n=1 Tax=Rhodopila sp. TaxID=2480087 RepID=UPI002C3AC365|nr:putative entry exclusion protein TrbK-alt [Rhodopila sp.]HVZ06623.1 putative entry exclusion protein TrbK-alt [Rhodopila sp.]
MLGRSDTFRVVAIIALIAVVVVSLVAIHQRPAAPAVETPSAVASPASDDLSAELRRCSALGPQDAEDARCVAVWEENRRRFFGRPARPLPPQAAPGAAAPATNAKGDAR